MAQVYDPNLAALSHSIQSTWPFGITEPADSDEIYLKAHLSNNVYTLIKATKTTTVQEAITMVAKNKQVRLDGFKVKIVTPVSQVDVTDLSRPLSDFHHPIGLILYNPAGSVVAENKPLLRGGRRASVVVAPKETHIRMASREFPKTVLDQAEATFTTGLGKGEFTTIPKPVRRRSRFSLKMFRREREISDDSASDTDSNKSGDNGSHEYTTSRLSSSKSASISRYLDENTPSRLPESKSFSVTRYLDETAESPTSSSDVVSSPTTWSPPVVDADGEIPYFNSNSDRSSMIRSETTSSIPESPLPDPDADVPSSFRKSSMIRSDTTSSIPESPLPDPDADVPSSFRKSDRTSMIRSETTSSIPDPPLPDLDADVPSSFRKPDRTSMIRSETTSSILNPPRSDSDADVSLSFHKPRPPLLRSETTTSVATLNRKRTTSSPTVPMNGNATLRRNTFRTRSRTQSEAPMPSNLEAAGISTVSIRVTYPDGSVSYFKMPQNITMESILKFSCTAQGNMDLEKYTFEALDQKIPIEMDRNLYFYVEKKVTSFVIVEREKEFSLKWVAEGDQDTMVLQIVGGEWLVMAATEQKLIERMTDGEIKTDLNFIDTLLLTYRSFMTPAKFFDELVCRFNAELPPDPSPEDMEYFEKMKGPSQEKVMTVFSWWIQYHIQDFTHNDEIRQELKQVLQEISEYPWFEKRAQEMNHMVDVKTKEYETLYGHILPSQVERKGKTMDSSLIQNLTAEELAQQLCIHDFDLFRNIPAIEYLNQIWRRPNDDEMLTCPSLDYFIARFDKVSYWLATEVCCVKDKKKRIQVLEKFIMTAKLCQTYGNFFTMFALIAGLSLNSVSRLKKTFDGLSKTAKATIEELEKLADPSRNMKNYRDCVSTTKPPIVPFLPIYLKDLTFINDGNESKIFNNMINFDKLRMIARRVHDITDMTKVEYKFPPQPIIQNYLNKPPAERDSQKLKAMSLECEQKK